MGGWRLRGVAQAGCDPAALWGLLAKADGPCLPVGGQSWHSNLSDLGDQ